MFDILGEVGARLKMSIIGPLTLQCHCHLQKSRSSMMFSLIQNIRCLAHVVIISNQKLICERAHDKAL